MALPSYKYGCPATTWKKIYVLKPCDLENYNYQKIEGIETYLNINEKRIHIRSLIPNINWFQIPSIGSGARTESIYEGEQFEALEKAREIALREKKLKRILDEI